MHTDDTERLLASFADHLLRHRLADERRGKFMVNWVRGFIRQIQELLGHAHVETTMIYTHVARGLRAPPRSPLDMLA